MKTGNRASPALRPGVRRRDPASEFATAERCHIIELSNSEADPDLSIAEARVEPGVITRWHCLHGIAERYVIISGRGRVEVGEQPPQQVGEGDVVLIPAGCRQRISNVGRGDLVFLALCTPRFVAAAYEDIDDAE